MPASLFAGTQHSGNGSKTQGCSRSAAVRCRTFSLWGKHATSWKSGSITWPHRKCWPRTWKYSNSELSHSTRRSTMPFPPTLNFNYISCFLFFAHCSCWVDIKAKLPIKLAGIKIRDMLLRPVDLDYSMVATMVRLLRELELDLADQRGTRPTRHFVVPEWLVRTL